MGWKFQNATPSALLIRSKPNFMINKAVITEYKVINPLAICQNLNILCHFEIFVNKEPCRAGNFKILLLVQFSSDLGQIL